MSAERYYEDAQRLSQRPSRSRRPSGPAGIRNAGGRASFNVKALAVQMQVDPQTLHDLLTTLDEMGTEARQKLEAKAIRQGLGPMYRDMKRTWKSHPVKRGSGKNVRKWASKAVTMYIDRYRVARGSHFSRERYGKVYISYKNKYKAARFAHLLEDPKGNYRTAGPVRKGIMGRTEGNRKYGRVNTGWKINHKVFNRNQAKTRAAFLTAVRGYLKGWDTKRVRKVTRRLYG